MKYQNSFELLSFLKSLNLLECSPSWWWPNHGNFEVVVSAILVQNTRWENVQKSLQNLYNSNILKNESEQDLFNLSACNELLLSSLIAPSGFANQKAKRLVNLSQNILSEFGSFEVFTQEVSGEWLLSQKGIGLESRDCILNYACLREVMVVDRYTQKLLSCIGYEIFDYQELQDWFMDGLMWGDIYSLYDRSISMAQIYARYHGKIVEFGKRGLCI